MRRTAPVLTAALLSLIACDDPAPPAPPPRAPAPEPAPEAAPAPPAPAPDRSPRAPSAEERAELRSLVREGRAAAHEERFEDALARFDEALRRSPSAPRLACEAGYVAHRAGREDAARRRIELGLRLFGDPQAAAPELRVPIAMCLYNAGLVADADEDPESAVERYRQSLALRPNATVEARLRAAEAAVRELEEEGLAHVAGVVYDEGVLRTPDAARLEEAIAAGLMGYDDFDEAWQSPAGVERVAEVALPSGGRPALVLVASNDSYPISSISLVVAIPVEDGWALRGTEVGGWDETDHGHDGGSALSDPITARLEQGLLRVDFEIASEQSFMGYEEGEDGEPCDTWSDDGEVRNRYAWVCEVTGAARCVDVWLGERTSRPGSSTRDCEGRAPEEESSDPPPPVVRSLSVAAGDRPITLATTTGAVPEHYLPDGSHRLDEAVRRHGVERIHLAADDERTDDDDDE